jgi:Flp pilus assembly pilin Flp
MRAGNRPLFFRTLERSSAVKFASLWKDEEGQDMVEYALLLAFVALTGAAMFISMGTMTSAIWGIVNTRMAASNQPS